MHACTHWLQLGSSSTSTRLLHSDTVSVRTPPNSPYILRCQSHIWPSYVCVNFGRGTASLGVPNHICLWCCASSSFKCSSSIRLLFVDKPRGKLEPISHWILTSSCVQPIFWCAHRASLIGIPSTSVPRAEHAATSLEVDDSTHLGKSFDSELFQFLRPQLVRGQTKCLRSTLGSFRWWCMNEPVYLCLLVFSSPFQPSVFGVHHFFIVIHVSPSLHDRVYWWLEVPCGASSCWRVFVVCNWSLFGDE